MNDWNPQANALFLRAMEKTSAADREAFLEAECGHDAKLRAGVEALIRALDAGGSFLDSPALLNATVDAPPIAEGPGTMIGPYKLLEQIGEGGMGVVFMAEQREPVRRKVALKIIKPGMDSKQVIARFEAERQALAVMDHPNVARIFDAGTIAQSSRHTPCAVRDSRSESSLADGTRSVPTTLGRPFFVMELVHGVPITEFCDESKLDTRERLQLFIDVCHAVQHAHQKGIIHRDIKPSNVLVTMDDDRPLVKVIDFGIAKATSGQLTDKTLFTGFTQFIGTPLYVSPEQAQMSARDVDTRSDVYSLGVVMYELLTGTTPFDQERLKNATFDELRQIIREEEPPRPSARVSTLGKPAHTTPEGLATDRRRLSQSLRGELDWIVMKCLEKDRRRRYETASGLAADVQRYLNDEPVQARPPSTWYRFGKFAKRNKVVLATTAVLAGAVLLALVSLVASVRVLAASNAQVKEKQKETTKALDGEKKANENLRKAVARAERSLAFQRIALAERELAANNIGRAEELLTECSQKLRGWEWHYLKRRVQEPPKVIPVTKKWILDMAYSPDGRYLATASLGFLFLGEYKVWDAATGKEVHTLRGHNAPPRTIVFSPDGSQLTAGGASNTVTIWDVATGKVLRTLNGHNSMIPGVAYSPDGKFLATASDDCTARIWNASTGAEVVSFPGHGAPVQCLAYSPDGRRVASWGMDFCVRVWDTATGQEQLRLPGHSGRIFNLHFHKDGRHLVSGGADGMRIWDLQTGKMNAITGINNACLRAVFSPDGQRLVSAVWDGSLQVWDWRNRQEVLSLRGHVDIVMALAFTGDGKRMASAGFDGTVRIWNATPVTEDPPGPSRRLQGHHKAQLGVGFSPDQRYLVTASMDGTAKLWDAASGRLRHVLRGLDKTYPSTAFHSGGKLLTTVTVDGTMIQWDVATGQRRRTWRGHVGPVLSTAFTVSFTADGEHFASLTKDGSIGIWETSSGKEVRRLPPKEPYFGVTLSPDGKHVAGSSLGNVKILEVKSGQTVATLVGALHMVHQMAFSADGMHLAAAYWDGTIKVWDIKSGKTLHTFRHTDRVTSVAFHPNGRQLASGSCDNTAKVWDLATGRELETLRGNIGYVMWVAYSPDGQVLATASGNRYRGEAQLWDTRTFGK